MKKTILSLAGVFTVLVSAAAFNVYGHFESKHQTCYASKYFFGHDVEKMCRFPGEYQGSNYRVMFLRHNNGQHTIGNSEREFYTWYMNK